MTTFQLFSPPSTSSTTSTTIPTIPPPLNVPPSRARRRLEQRLNNRHAQNAQAQLAAQVNSSTSDPSDNLILTRSPEPNHDLIHRGLFSDENDKEGISNPFMSPNLEELARNEEDAFGGFESADDAFEGGGGGFDGAGEKEGPRLAPPVELMARRRVFDLEDEDLDGFANSPAGEAEEGDSGDVDMEEGFEEDVGVVMIGKGD
jgi:hypothetical protein